MYAIIKTGGKQYKVTPECVLDVEKLDLEAGKPVKFEEVLAIGEEGGQLKVGTPLLTGAVVEGEVMEQFRAEKVWAFKMKRRKSYRRTIGHRQNLTKVKITEEYCRNGILNFQKIDYRSQSDNIGDWYMYHHEGDGNRTAGLHHA